MSINPRITQKQVKEGYRTLAYCGYSELQYTLKDARKVGHTDRVEGGLQMCMKSHLVSAL